MSKLSLNSAAKLEVLLHCVNHWSKHRCVEIGDPAYVEAHQFLITNGLIKEIPGTEHCHFDLTDLGKMHLKALMDLPLVDAKGTCFDWSLLPVCFNYVAMDLDGGWWAYELKPELVETEWAVNKRSQVIRILPAHAPKCHDGQAVALLVRPGTSEIH